MISPPGTQPPGGWRFPATDSVTLTAPTKELLIEQLTRWRIRNGVATGSPEQDIDAYLCSITPNFCHPTTRDYAMPAHLQDNRKFLDRVGEWIWTLKTEMPVGGYRLVPESVANERVAGCTGCPRNRQMNSSCPACMTAFNESFAEVRNLRPKPAGCGGMACSLLGFDTFTAACLPRELVEPSGELKELLPVNCWLAKAEETQ